VIVESEVDMGHFDSFGMFLKFLLKVFVHLHLFQLCFEGGVDDFFILNLSQILLETLFKVVL
jgi:hypothetical protein